jgi:WD40 repeat protein
MVANWEDDVLWTVSGDKTAIRWNLQTNKSDTTLTHPDFVKSIGLLPSGHVITGCRDEHIRVYDPSVFYYFDLD